MIAIVSETSWPCGRYVVRRICRIDNPAWPAYVIFRHGTEVGRSFSVPDESWCEAIERMTELGRYVEKPSQPKRYTYRLSK